MLAQHIPPAVHGGEEQASAAAPVAEKCWSTNDEQFEAESLSGLIMANDWLRAGDIVYVGDKKATALSALCDADDVIDLLRDRASDIAGEHADGYPDVTDEEKKLLDAAIAGWIALCCPPTFFGVENVRKHKLTDLDLDAAARAVIASEA